MHADLPPLEEQEGLTFSQVWNTLNAEMDQVLPEEQVAPPQRPPALNNEMGYQVIHEEQNQNLVFVPNPGFQNQVNPGLPNPMNSKLMHPGLQNQVNPGLPNPMNPRVVLPMKVGDSSRRESVGSWEVHTKMIQNNGMSYGFLCNGNEPQAYVVGENSHGSNNATGFGGQLHPQDSYGGFGGFSMGMSGNQFSVSQIVPNRRYKNRIKNRESAARSRARKKAYTTQLEIEVEKLKEENQFLKKVLKVLDTPIELGRKKRLVDVHNLFLAEEVFKQRVGVARAEVPTQPKVPYAGRSTVVERV